MKCTNTLLFAIVSIVFVFNSKAQSKQLSENEIATTFSLEEKEKYNITYNIHRAYSYKDTQGDHLILMTQHPSKKSNTAFIKENTTQYHDSIKAYFFDTKSTTLKLRKVVTDFIIRNKESEEFSISFWTKFFELKDYDKNGTIDPILIYGSFGSNGTNDGRIKILSIQDGKKITIRHQNSILDGGRITEIDSTFYDLPLAIQEQIVRQMRAITKNNSGIFPWNWEQERKERKLRIVR